MSQAELRSKMSCELTRLPLTLARIATLAFCGWMLIVLALGGRMAYQSISESLSALDSARSTDLVAALLAPASPEPAITFAIAALAIYSVVFVTIVLSRIFRPNLTAVIAFLVPVAIFALAVAASGAMHPALAACAIFATSWTAGDLVLRLFKVPTTRNLLGEAAIRISLGLGCLGTAILILGSFNGISLAPIVMMMLLVNLAWVVSTWPISGGTLSRNLPSELRAPPLSWFESILLALSAAFFVFAALAALTPGTILTASDSVRQHLPLAREIWQNHALLVFPGIEPGSASVLGASLNAVAFGLGGAPATGIFQVLVSFGCIIAIAGLGVTLAGRLAGIAGAAIFSAMPLVLWLSGHVYPDLLAVLFICSAAQCAINWQRDGRYSWLIISGAFAGFSLATKQISAVVVVALFIGLVIAARPGATVVDRLRAGLCISLACLIAIVPWFIRSTILTGTFPLLGTILTQVSIVPELGTISEAMAPDASPAAPLSNLAETFSGGVTRTLPGIIAGPWDLTFHGAFSNWQSVRHGEFGILLLMFLPLVLVNLCSRGTVLIAITACISFVGWVFTIQVPRHLLPSLALLAVLAGISVANVSKGQLASLRLLPGRLAQVCAIAGLALTPLYFLPNITTGFPISVVTGATSPEDYVARVDPATEALRAATAQLPADTLVGYIGEWLGAQSSTEVRLFYLGSYSPNPGHTLDSVVGDSPETILEYFAAWGIENFIWDRPDTRPQDVESTLLSGDFLLHYTTILGGDNGIYLFALHPSGVPDPTSGTNLLQDPAFASLRKTGNVWNGSRRDLSESGVLQPRRQTPVSQRVAVEPGQQYLLVLEGSCDSVRNGTRVSLTWLDDNGRILSTTADDLPFGTRLNSALMWRVAPEEATAAEVSISTAAGAPCQVRKIGMYPYGALLPAMLPVA